MTSDCVTLNREPQLACAFSGYCNAQTFEELYQDFLASPYSYATVTPMPAAAVLLRASTT